MEFEGRFVYLTEEEVATTGIDFPLQLTKESMSELHEFISWQSQNMRQIQADEDELTHSARCEIFAAANRISRCTDIFYGIAKERRVKRFVDSISEISYDKFLELTDPKV